MEQTHADGFHVVTGLLSVIAGPVMLIRGEPAGWSFLLIATGVTLLVTEWAIVHDIELVVMNRTDTFVAIAGVVCLAVAIVYLTRAANDLPSLFPGHDGDSEHFRLLPGILALTVGSAILGRAVIAARPRRAHHKP